MPYKDKSAHRAYQNAWKKRRRQEWLDENGPCACGSVVDLEIHHKDPAQKVEHRVWSWREGRRLKELAKCIVKCKKCHQGEHWQNLIKPVVHGTPDGYNHHKCRCDSCKEVTKKYRQNLKRD